MIMCLLTEALRQASSSPPIDEKVVKPMHLSFYHLEKEPFNATPDPGFLFLSPSHKEALDAMAEGIEKRKGVVCIFGQRGVGKTTILRTYLGGLSPHKHKIVHIFDPELTYEELLRSILRGLDLVPASNDLNEILAQLRKKLIIEYRANITVIVAIDEAHNISIETLEHLRLLSNLEISTAKLLQLILVGQPKLQSLLKQPRLQQLQQRIAMQATITSLTPKESRDYIKHRIQQASTGRSRIFSNGAIQLICKHSQGIPRRINKICDNAMRTGYDCKTKPVSTKIVKEIIGDGKTSQHSRMWKWSIGIAAVALLSIGIGLWQQEFMPKLIEIRTMLEAQISSPSTQMATHHVPSDNTMSIIERARDMSPHDTLLDSSLPRTFSHIVEEARPSNATTHNQRSNDNAPPKPVSQSQPKRHVSLEETVPQTIFPKVRTSKQITRRQDIYASSRLQTTNTLQPIDTATIFSQTQSVATQNQRSPTIRSVYPGESLSEITQEVYGSTNPKYLRWVEEHNPQLLDPDRLQIGQQLILPEFPEE